MPQFYSFPFISNPKTTPLLFRRCWVQIKGNHSLSDYNLSYKSCRNITKSHSSIHGFSLGLWGQMSTLQTQQVHTALRFLVLPPCSGCIRSSFAIQFQWYGSLLISNCVDIVSAEAKQSPRGGFWLKRIDSPALGCLHSCTCPTNKQREEIPCSWQVLPAPHWCAKWGCTVGLPEVSSILIDSMSLWKLY